MSVLQYVILYLATLGGFLCIDMIWLGLVARTFYRDQLGYLLSPRPNWIAAIIFYLIFVGGLLVFAVLPGLQSASMKKGLTLCALFGFVTYATYDLTNLATVKDWPWKVTVVDLCWGTILAAATGWIGLTVGRWLESG